MRFLLVKREGKIGRLLDCACFGPFGGREIGELLIIVKF